MILIEEHYEHLGLYYDGLTDNEYKSFHKQNPSTSCEEALLKHECIWTHIHQESSDSFGFHIIRKQL